MVNVLYLIGVENYGGLFCIWFLYKGKCVRENFGVFDIVKNCKIVGELCFLVCFVIRMGNFNYVEKFLNLLNFVWFGQDRKEIIVLEFIERWLELKRMEISFNIMSRYEFIIKNMFLCIGENKMVFVVIIEDLLYVRKELLMGFYVMKKDYCIQVKGWKFFMVNNYMMLMVEIFQFGVDNGYVKENLFSGINCFRKVKDELDLFIIDEFIRFIQVCGYQQM